MDGDQNLKLCENCQHDIPTINFVIHTVYCKKNIRRCPECNEPLPVSEIEKHYDNVHSVVQCAKCSAELLGSNMPAHIETDCPATIISCEYCELELARKEMTAHKSYCETRTEKCACGNYVMYKYQKLHIETNHTFLKLDDEHGPKSNWKDNKKISGEYKNYSNQSSKNENSQYNFNQRKNVLRNEISKSRNSTNNYQGNTTQHTDGQMNNRSLISNERQYKVSGRSNSDNFDNNCQGKSTQRTDGRINNRSSISNEEQYKVTGRSNSDNFDNNRQGKSTQHTDGQINDRSSISNERQYKVAGCSNNDNFGNNYQGNTTQHADGRINNRSSISNERQYKVTGRSNSDNSDCNNVSYPTEGSYPEVEAGDMGSDGGYQRRGNDAPRNIFNDDVGSSRRYIKGQMRRSNHQNWRTNNKNKINNPRYQTGYNNFNSHPSSSENPTQTRSEEINFDNDKFLMSNFKYDHPRNQTRSNSSNFYNPNNFNNQRQARDQDKNFGRNSKYNSNNSSNQRQGRNQENNNSRDYFAKDNFYAPNDNKRNHNLRQPPNEDAKRDRAYHSALLRSQQEKKQRDAENAYNYANNLSPVLTAAEKVEKLRKMSALQNRESAGEIDYSKILNGRVWRASGNSSGEGQRLGAVPKQYASVYHSSSDSEGENIQPAVEPKVDLSNLKPMSEVEMDRRIAKREEESTGGIKLKIPFIKRWYTGKNDDSKNDDSKSDDSKSDIRAGLTALRRNLNQAMAPLKANTAPVARPPKMSPRRTANLPENSNNLLLPCEFCEELIPEDDLVLHETGCRPDLANLTLTQTGRTQNRHYGWGKVDLSDDDGGGAVGGGWDNGESYNHDDLRRFYKEADLPCEICNQLFPASVLMNHQERCRYH